MLVTTVDGLLKNSLVDYAIDNNNLDMIKSLAKGEYEVVKENNKKANLIEIVGIDLDLWEQVSVYEDDSLTMLQLEKVLYEQDIELDVQTTLEIYLDNEWVMHHILEIENDFDIMSTPLAELLNDYAIYGIVNKKYSF